jgi:hypothetical protein
MCNRLLCLPTLTITLASFAIFMCFLSVLAMRGILPSLAAFRSFETLKIDAADFIWRDRVPALRAQSVECGLNFFEIDFLLPGHCPTLAWDCPSDPTSGPPILIPCTGFLPNATP